VWGTGWIPGPRFLVFRRPHGAELFAQRSATTGVGWTSRLRHVGPWVPGACGQYLERVVQEDSAGNSDRVRWWFVSTVCLAQFLPSDVRPEGGRVVPIETRTRVPMFAPPSDCSPILGGLARTG